MSQILRRMADSFAGFCPRDCDEFFALQLARKLGDPAGIAYYVRLANVLPQHLLIVAFRRTVKKSRRHGLADRFKVEIARLQGSGKEVA